MYAKLFVDYLNIFVKIYEKNSLYFEVFFYISLVAALSYGLFALKLAYYTASNTVSSTETTFED